MTEVTMDRARQVLDEKFGGVLRAGKHEPPNGTCECCVEELRSYLLDLPWTDDPDGSAVAAAVRHLNDSDWSSDVVRTRHCLPLVLLDGKTIGDAWVDEYADQTIRVVGMRADLDKQFKTYFERTVNAAEAADKAAWAAWASYWAAEATQTASRDATLIRCVAVFLECVGRPDLIVRELE